MTYNPSVLVGVDGSPGSSAAVRFGAREAYRLGTGVRLVHVISAYVPVSPLAPLTPLGLEDAGKALLERAADQARELLPSSPIVTTLLEGPRIPALLRAARQAQLVVLGHDQGPSLDRLATGATVTGIAAHATCPVVAISPDHVVEEEHGSVLVAIKSTEHSHDLLRRGFETAAGRGARLLVVHAWEFRREYDELVTARMNTQAWERRARHALSLSIDPFRESMPEVRAEVRVVHGQPARVLCEVSAEADLVLLARRAHAFPLGHVGPTARAVLHHNSCPIMIVPAAEGHEEQLDLLLEDAGVFLK